MKTLTLIALFILSFSALASNVVTCEDKKQNLIMVRETSAMKYKLIGLDLNGHDYMAEGSVYCEPNTDGPIGGVRNSVEITCELNNDLVAQIKYVDGGAATISLLNSNSESKSFKGFSCK